MFVPLFVRKINFTMIRSSVSFFFLSLLIHFLFIFLGFSYFEEGGDTFIKNTLSGVFLNQPALPPFSFGAHFGLSYVYLWFYNFIPSIPWYDLFTVFYSTLAATLVFLCFKRVLHKVRTSIVFSLSLLLFLDNILMLEITRISMFIAICSAFLILSSSIIESKWKLIFFQFTLTLSVFLRIESFFLSILLMISIFFINIDYLRNLKYLLPSFCIAVTLSVLLNIDWTERDRIYNELRPFQFVLLDFETKNNNFFENMEDSIKMEVSKSFFLNDKENINSDFYNKYLSKQDRNIFHLKNFLTKTDFSYSAIIKKLQRTELRYYLWIFLVFIYILLSQNKTKKIDAIKVTVYCLLILFTILVFFKMENRVLFPSLLGLLLLILVNNNVKYKTQLLFLACIIFLLLPDKKYQELNERYTDVEIVYEKIKALPENNIVFFDMHLTVWQGRKPFHNPISEKKVFSFDNALLFTTNEYKQTMILNFKSDATIDVLKKSINNPDIVFFGELQRAKLINNYFNLIHNFNSDIIIFDSISPRVSRYNLKSKI
jgi:hypothetical protein